MGEQYQEAVDRLQAFVAEGRIIRNRWTGKDAQGRETACLLASLSPEVGRQRSAAACPAEIMPAWLSRLTPTLDDGPSKAVWPEVVRRYAAVAARWHVLTPEDWQILNYACRAVAVREACDHVGDDANVAKLAINVLALLDRAAAGESVAAGEWVTAGAEAAATWGAEAAAARWAAAEVAAEAATRWEAEAATWAAAAAEAAGVRRAGSEAVAEAAWDRMASAILTALEDACTAREAANG